MANCEEVAFVVGVARRSATTAAMMLVVAVWEVALRFVCTPTGIKPKAAIRQKAAMPIARVTSTKENANVCSFFIGDRYVCRLRTRLSELLRDFPTLD